MFSWRDLPRTPAIVAHRGSSARAPENTLSAFERALRDGADAVELDVQLTSDGHAVVIHDFTLRRTSGRSGRVAETALSDLRLLDVGGGSRRAERVPLLDEVLDLLAGNIGVNIELKVPRGGRRGRELLEAVLRSIRARRAEPSALVSSFNHRLIADLVTAHPDIPAGLLLSPAHTLRPPLAGGADALIAGRRWVTRGFTDRCHRRGVKVGAYTVNAAREAQRLRGCGVEIIITDDPLVLRKSLS